MDTNGGGCIKNKTGYVIIEGGTFNVPNYIKYDAVNLGGALAVENQGGTVIINGGTFNSKTDAYMIANRSGTMTINNGVFEAHRGIIHAGAGELTINNGSYKTAGEAHGIYVANASVKINNGTFVHTGAGSALYVDKVDDEGKIYFTGTLTIKSGVVCNGNIIDVDQTHNCEDGDWTLK